MKVSGVDVQQLGIHAISRTQVSQVDRYAVLHAPKNLFCIIGRLLQGCFRRPVTRPVAGVLVVWVGKK